MKRFVLGMLLCVSVLAAGAEVGGRRGPEQKAEPRPCGKLSSYRPGADLKAAMEPYRFKAYSYTDGKTVVKVLHYSPKAKGSRKFPMVIYMPGTGERGELINQFRQRSLFDLVTSSAFQEKHPCHLIALSPPATEDTLQGGFPGRPTPLQRLLHDSILAVAESAKVGVDLQRLYMTGFSYGGSGAYALAQHFPGEYAAVVPIAAYPPLMRFFKEDQPGNWWHFQNEDEYKSYPEGMDCLKAYQKKTNEAGGDFRIAVYPAEGHDAWRRTWAEPELWDWVFSKTKGKASLRQKAAGQVKGSKRPVGLTSAKCTSSVEGMDAGTGPDRLLDGLDSTWYAPRRTFEKGDWLMVEFAAPVAGRVQIYSGDKSGANRLTQAVVEVSSNGKTWRRTGTFSSKDGICTFTQSASFAYLRVRVTSERTEAFTLRRMTLAAVR